MPSQEEIADQQKLLATHRRTLAHLLRQAAQYGGEVFAPPQTANGIVEARTNILRIKQILRDWDTPAEDHTNDEEGLSENPTSSTHRMSESSKLLRPLDLGRDKPTLDM